MASETSPAGEAGSSTDSEGNSSSFECPECGKGYKSAEGVKYHLRETECSGFECPTCGRVDFYSRHSLECHHKEVHDESIGGVVIECEICSDEFRVRPVREDTAKYCGYECRGVGISRNRTGENHPRYTGLVEKDCDNCGGCFEVYPCNTEQRFCSTECMGEWNAENRTGKNAANWRGGSAPKYGLNWEEQREKALERDGYACVSCGVSNKEHLREYGASLHVHHIERRREFIADGRLDYESANSLSNLMSVCYSCHGVWESIGVHPQID